MDDMSRLNGPAFTCWTVQKLRNSRAQSKSVVRARVATSVTRVFSVLEPGACKIKLRVACTLLTPFRVRSSSMHHKSVTTDHSHRLRPRPLRASRVSVARWAQPASRGCCHAAWFCVPTPQQPVLRTNSRSAPCTHVWRAGRPSQPDTHRRGLVQACSASDDASEYISSSDGSQLFNVRVLGVFGDKEALGAIDDLNQWVLHASMLQCM